MQLTETEIHDAETRLRTRMRRQPRAASARYEPGPRRILVTLSSGLEIGIPVSLAQGLAGEKAADLSEIEISPTGLGLHWPRLDADLYLPAIIEGIFGSRSWMARALGQAGGKSTSRAKRAAARVNGRLGGRPRKLEHA